MPDIDYAFASVNTENANKAINRKLFPIVEKKRTGLQAFGTNQIEDSPFIIRQTKHTVALASYYKAKTKVEEARQLLIEAAQALKDDNKEQTKILDLLEVFRDYTEDRPIQKLATSLAKQASSIGNAANRLDKIASRPSYAQVVKTNQTANGTESSTTTTNTLSPIPTSSSSSLLATKEQEWTTIQSRIPKDKQLPARLILRLANPTVKPSAIEIRNKINEAYQGPILLSSSVSLKGNLVLYLRDQQAKETVLKEEHHLRDIVDYSEVVEDKKWHKVVIHGISTTDFATNGPLLIKEEIENYNTGFKVVGTPIWLTSTEKRTTQTSASALVAFETEDEAFKAIRQRLYIGGVSVKVEKAREREEPNVAVQPTPKPSQC